MRDGSDFSPGTNRSRPSFPQGLKLTDVTGLAHVRNRDYSASLGRFIERDPIGFDAGDNNWYRFVGNRPGTRIDPLGLCGKGTCGPDIVDWLAAELAIVDKWVAVTEKLVIDTYPWGIDPQYWVAARLAARITVLGKVAPQLEYFPKTLFSTEGCPAGPECVDTVTLCGMCIHTSEIGNIVFGRMSKAFGFSLFVTHLAAKRGGRGDYTPQDRAAVEAGWSLDVSALCNVFKSTPSIAADIVKGADGPCAPCAGAVDSKANHVTLPTIVRGNIWTRPGGGGGNPTPIDPVVLPKGVQ